MAVALIVAAGSGERLGAGMPKALVQLHGRTLLQWSVEALSRTRAVSQIVVALPEGVAVPEGAIGVRGGATRSESVREALAAANGDGGDADVVLVHDAARPLLTPALAEAVIAAAEAPHVDAAIAAVPVSDTIKRARDGIVVETLPRSELWAVQTPQAFRRAALERALAAPDDVLAQATDDAWLVERAGGRVVIVESSPENLKITTPLDLDVATALLLRRRAETPDQLETASLDRERPVAPDRQPPAAPDRRPMPPAA